MLLIFCASYYQCTGREGGTWCKIERKRDILNKRQNSLDQYVVVMEQVWVTVDSLIAQLQTDVGYLNRARDSLYYLDSECDRQLYRTHCCATCQGLCVDRRNKLIDLKVLAEQLHVLATTLNHVLVAKCRLQQQ